MGKKIIWSSDALDQLEDIHFYIFFESKSITIADKVVNTIFESTDILKKQPEIYKLDKQKTNNDGSFRVYSVYDIVFHIQ
ncbi:hypothetical protein D3C85_1620960 [compost metagenome]